MELIACSPATSVASWSSRRRTRAATDDVTAHVTTLTAAIVATIIAA